VLTNVTDRQTDRQTDVKRRHDRYIAKACSGKNVMLLSGGLCPYTCVNRRCFEALPASFYHDALFCVFSLYIGRRTSDVEMRECFNRIDDAWRPLMQHRSAPLTERERGSVMPGLTASLTARSCRSIDLNFTSLKYASLPAEAAARPSSFP